MGASTPFPSPAAIARAELFTRERFVFEGESLEDALAPGSARRRALDAALSELDHDARQPSIGWRRNFSLLLGLERLLSEEEPQLVDGTVLSAHQVDALSGTLTALMAEAQRGSAANGNGNGNGSAEAPAPRAATAAATAEKTNGRPSAPPALTASPGDEGDDDEDPDLDEDEPEDEEPQDWEDEEEEEGQLEEQPDDPNAARRFWFEHATGAGKTVAALGFVEASRTGGVLILTHRRNLVDQFHGELRDRGYRDRISAPLMGDHDSANGPVTVETYQWFVRNVGKISDAYTIVICDEAHTALGEKTSASIRGWAGPVFVGMTATGALIARHVTDLFPTQTSRFDLAQAARRGVISPLRCIRIPPGPGVRTIAKVPLRRGEVDTEFDQEMLAELLDQTPFNLAIADLYKTRFNGVPGVVYAAGVRHAYNVAAAFRDLGMKAQGVSGETPKRQLAKILADYEAGKVDVLVNAQLLAEGWNSPRATVCMHLAPTASKRIYQQRVGRVTRRHPGKEAGIVVDFVHPATKHDDPVVTLHSLLDRDVYRGGAIVVGPVRRGRGRRVRVERRVLPVTPEPERRAAVFERELWRIAVENLDYEEQHVWAALAGARVAPNGWRRAKAMLHFDRGGELKRRFLITAVQRNRNPQLRLRALQEIAAARDAEAFDTAIDIMAGWPRDERREGVKVMLQALAERRIGRRDQANAWIWRLAEYTREVHEEYAAQRWPETKRLLGLLVNSSGSAHARNARRLVHASRKEDRRLSAALLAAALAHTPEAEEALRGARTRMARKPAALARELLRNFPKGRRGKSRRKRRGTGPGETVAPGSEEAVLLTELDDDLDDGPDDDDDGDDTDLDDDLDTADIDDDDDDDDLDEDTPRKRATAKPARTASASQGDGARSQRSSRGSRRRTRRPRPAPDAPTQPESVSASDTPAANEQPAASDTPATRTRTAANDTPATRQPTAASDTPATRTRTAANDTPATRRRRAGTELPTASATKAQATKTAAEAIEAKLAETERPTGEAANPTADTPNATSPSRRRTRRPAATATAADGPTTTDGPSAADATTAADGIPAKAENGDRPAADAKPKRAPRRKRTEPDPQTDNEGTEAAA